jgi:hypothetical protein
VSPGAGAVGVLGRRDAGAGVVAGPGEAEPAVRRRTSRGARPPAAARKRTSPRPDVVTCRQLVERGLIVAFGSANVFHPATTLGLTASARPGRGPVLDVTVAAVHAHEEARTATRWRAERSA